MAASAGRVLLIPKGTYNAATTYNMLDVVYYNAASYVCKQTSLGNLPTDTYYWQLLASGIGTAAQVSFDPTGTGLVATNVQNAVVEVRNNISNPNLLTNPWFTVNQRGSNSYSGQDIYTVDRWKMKYSTSGTVAVSSSGITLSGVYLYITQPFESLTQFMNKTLTASILLSDGTLYTGTGTYTGSHVEFINEDGGNLLVWLHTGTGGFMVACTNSSTYTIRAVKLELGSISTLALDTAPDYTTELLKCQRYYYRVAARKANATMAAVSAWNSTTVAAVIPTPVPLRTNTPTFSSGGTMKVMLGASTTKTISSISMGTDNGYQSILLFFTVASGAVEGMAGLLVASASGGDYLAFDAEL